MRDTRKSQRSSGSYAAKELAMADCKQYDEKEYEPICRSLKWDLFQNKTALLASTEQAYRPDKSRR